MTKDELRELAQWGVRRKVQEIEQQLASLQQEFPELFVSQTRPILLKADVRQDGANVFEPPAPQASHPEGTHTERALAYLAEHPMSPQIKIAKGLGIKPSSLSSVIFKLKKKRKIWQPEGDTRWALREKGPRRLPPGEPVKGPGKGKGPHAYARPGTIADKVRTALRAGGEHMVYDLANQLKKKSASVRSALLILRSHGEVKENDETGAWTAVSASQDATAEQPWLALDPQPGAPVKPRGGLGSGTKFLKERWYTYLQANGPSRLVDAERALNAASASLITSSGAWLSEGIIKRQKSGLYAVGKVKPDPRVLEAAAARYEAGQNGASA